MMDVKFLFTMPSCGNNSCGRDHVHIYNSKLRVVDRQAAAALAAERLLQLDGRLLGDYQI